MLSTIFQPPPVEKNCTSESDECQAPFVFFFQTSGMELTLERLPSLIPASKNAELSAHKLPIRRAGISQVNVAFLKLSRKIERGFKRLYRPYLMWRLKKTNLTSSQSILEPTGPVVTLTTFDKRIDSVFYAIESIAAGKVLPSRLTLWLEHELMADALPDSLQRLQARGLEILGTEDLGPHKKYYPEIQNERDEDRPFVTADDDTLYPVYWLQKLVESLQHRARMCSLLSRSPNHADKRRNASQLL